MESSQDADNTNEAMSLKSPQNHVLGPTSISNGDRFSQYWEEVPICQKTSLLLSRTPQREWITPNSGKKRVHNLSRCSPGSSHHDKMSTIFQDAGRALNPAITPRPSMANARRFRTSPFATRKSRIRPIDADNGEHSPHPEDSLHEVKARNQIGRLLISSTPLPDENGAAVENESCDDAKGSSRQLISQMNYPTGVHLIQPVGSGRAGPTAREAKDSQLKSVEVVYPDLTTMRAPAAYTSPDAVLGTKALGQDLHPSTSRVENWLMDVFDHGQPDPAKSPASSGISMARSALLPGAALSSRHPRCQSPYSESSYLAPGQFDQPPFSRGYFTEPPNRKIPRVSPAQRKSPRNPEQQIIIYEDETSNQLPELSPSVERYRKGCGPKRKRCVSYWDTDILPELAIPPREPMEPVEGNQRQALGELTSLTRAKAFAEGVEDAQFDFEVHL
ncbi:MAG: hypothetical protein Q9188_000541 [Gyalolechia gomerana]